VAPSSTPVGWNPEQERPAKTEARVEGWTGVVHLFLHDDHGEPGLGDLPRLFFSGGPVREGAELDAEISSVSGLQRSDGYVGVVSRKAIAQRLRVFKLGERSQLKRVIERIADGLDPIGAAVDYLKSHRDGAGAHGAEGLCGGVGKIEDAVFGKRSPVVDGKFHRGAVFQVRHHHPGAEGQGLMRRRQFMLVVNDSARSRLAVKAGAVP